MPPSLNESWQIFEIRRKQEIVITKNGKEIAKLAPVNKQGIPNADFLYGLMQNFPNKDISLRRIMG